jgi:hypothetical protein
MGRAFQGVGEEVSRIDDVRLLIGERAEIANC